MAAQVHELIALLRRENPSALAQIAARYPERSQTFDLGQTLGGETSPDMNCAIALASLESCSPAALGLLGRLKARARWLRRTDLFAKAAATLGSGAVLSTFQFAYVPLIAAGFALAGSLLALVVSFLDGGTPGTQKSSIVDRIAELSTAIADAQDCRVRIGAQCAARNWSPDFDALITRANEIARKLNLDILQYG